MSNWDVFIYGWKAYKIWHKNGLFKQDLCYSVGNNIIFLTFTIGNLL